MESILTIRPELASDADAVTELYNICFGQGWQTRRPAARLRASVQPNFGLVAYEDAVLAGAVRFSLMAVGARPVWLLGPLAVAPVLAGRGIGRSLIDRGRAAAWQQHDLPVLLVGDPAYYARSGFQTLGGAVELSGEDPARIMGCGPGLASISGFLSATQRPIDRQ